MNNENNIYILVASLPLEDKRYSFGKCIEFQSFDTKFSIPDLAVTTVCDDKFNLLLPEINKLTCEIILKDCAKDKAPFRKGYFASVLLMLLGYHEHLLLSASNYSWNIIAGREKRSGVIFESPRKGRWHEQGATKDYLLPKDWKGMLLDFHPHVIKISSNHKTTLTKKDAEWITNNIGLFEILYENKAFKLAIDAFIRCRLQTNQRATIAMLWSGIEAIFGINTEITFKLSSYCAAIIYPKGEDRLKEFKNIKKLYGMRSKAVHGMDMKEDEILETIEKSHKLLENLLMVCIEKKRVFGIDDCEESLFMS